MPAGIVEFSEVQSTTAELTPDAALAVLQLPKNRDRYRSCYGKALAGDSHASGYLKLKVAVSGTGEVDRVDVIGGSFSPSPIVQCSVAMTKQIRFQPPPPPSTLRYRVDFKTPPR